jgi:hypothetical protein
MKTSEKKYRFKLLLFLLLAFLATESSSQDVIVLNTGDSIECKITGISNDTIYMDALYKGKTAKTIITKNRVKEYRIFVIEKLKKDNDTSLYYSILLTDGNQLNGKVTGIDQTIIHFHDGNLGQITFPVFKVEKIETDKLDAYYLIKLADGNEFYGKLIERRLNEIVLNTENLGIVTIPNAKIKKMQMVEEGKMEDGKYRFPNPNNTRYYFAPSAINLKKGEGYYQNVYFLMNSANYGVTNNFSIGGGIIIPFAVFITPKVSFKITEKFHAGVGSIMGFIPGPEFVGIAYAITTYGTNENNITLGTGWGFYDDEYADRPIITLNAMARLSRKVALVTENWSIPFTRTNYDVYPMTEKKVYDTYVSYGVRVMGEKITFDIALVNSKDIFEFMPLGVPYVDFVYKF